MEVNKSEFDEDFYEIRRDTIPPIIYKKVRLFESGYYLTLRFTYDEQFIEYCFDREGLCEAHFSFGEVIAKQLRAEMNLVITASAALHIFIDGFSEGEVSVKIHFCT